MPENMFDRSNPIDADPRGSPIAIEKNAAIITARESPVQTSPGAMLAAAAKRAAISIATTSAVTGSR
jgi:hypothetical protein